MQMTRQKRTISEAQLAPKVQYKALKVIIAYRSPERTLLQQILMESAVLEWLLLDGVVMEVGVEERCQRMPLPRWEDL